MMSEAFSRILSAGRAHFNQRVVEARRRHPALDTAAFGDFLLSCVDPLVTEVARIDADRAPAVALAAFDLALESAALSLVGPGSRSQSVASMWRELAPRAAHLVAQQPAHVLGLLGNAVVHIESVAGARPAQWLGEMIEVAPRLATVADLQAAGQVIAWRSGISHFRKGAIEAAGRLDPAVALSIFGGSKPWEQVRAALVADPWWRPDLDASVNVEAGSFTGFGGAFIEPVAVRPHADGFLVRCRDRYFLLIADAFGAVLHSAAPEEFDESAPDNGAGFSLRGSLLRIGTRRISLDLPADGLQACSNGTTIALTSPYTHAILLYPAQ